MRIKEFYKLTLVRIITFIFLVIVVSFIPRTINICNMMVGGQVECGRSSGFNGIGYPTFYGSILARGDAILTGFSLTNFIINIIVWYTVSCFIITLVRMVKRKI